MSLVPAFAISSLSFTRPDVNSVALSDEFNQVLNRQV